MRLFRIALANLPHPATPERSVNRAVEAIAAAAKKGAGLLCFPECYVPGYRVGKNMGPPDPEFLVRAWSAIAVAAGQANIAVVVGTERMIEDSWRITALVIDHDGSLLGFQDKVQLDPSEDALYTAGSGRQVFQTGALTFGVAICHEGWRYPETVREAARQGAQVVFHPHLQEAEAGGVRPKTFADPANTFHEKAVLCRAAENTCYFASVNYAIEGSITTSAVARPDGTLLAYQPYSVPGLLIADVDLDAATGLLAKRLRA